MKPAHTSGAAIAIATALLILAVDAPLGVASAAGARGKVRRRQFLQGQERLRRQERLPRPERLQGPGLSRADQGRMQQDPRHKVQAV